MQFVVDFICHVLYDIYKKNKTTETREELIMETKEQLYTVRLTDKYLQKEFTWKNVPYSLLNRLRISNYLTIMEIKEVN